MTSKLKSILVVTFTFFVISYKVVAQNTYPLTADSAVQLAFKNVVELKNLTLDSLLQRAKNREITGSAMPQVSGSITGQHFFNIPVTVLPDFLSPAVYGVLVQQGVKDGNGNTIQMPSTFGTFPAQFGVPWSVSAGFTVQQLLFQPDVFVGLKARATSLDYVSGNLNVMRDSIKSNVYKTYYAVLIAEKRLLFLKEGVKRLEKLYADQQVMYKNGFIESLDLDKTQVSLNNLKATVHQVTNGVSLGYAALKFAMGINQKDNVILKDTLSIDAIKAGVLETETLVYENRPEIQLLNSVKKLQELDLQRNKLQYIPTIAAFWNFSKNAQRQKFDFFNKGDWFTTNLVGLSVNIPIWDGGQREAKIKQAKFNLEKTNNTLTFAKNGIDLQFNAAKITLNNAFTMLDMQQRNLALAEKVYNTTKKKYEQGLGSSFELLQVEQSYEDAQSNYFQSLYEAIVAKVGLLKATGKL